MTSNVLSVSYTHLDVYKRQHLDGGALGKLRRGEGGHVPQVAIPAQQDRGGLAGPVSYTHLDVYKRQAVRNPVTVAAGAEWCGRQTLLAV